MKASRSIRPFRDRAWRAARCAALLLLLASCERAATRMDGSPDGYNVTVESPRLSHRYPAPIPITVTLRNGGTAPHVLTFPPPRFTGVCADGLRLPPPVGPVEIFFAGEQDAGRTRVPYVWRAPGIDAPPRLVLAPGKSVVYSATFHPPPGGRVHGGFCVRVYGWELGTGIGYAGVRR